LRQQRGSVARCGGVGAGDRIAAEVHRGRGLARRQTADRSRRLQGAPSNALCNLPSDTASRRQGASVHRFSGRAVQYGSGSAKSVSKVIEGAEVNGSMFEVWRHWWVTAVGAKRTFAEKLCQLTANRQHHSISSLDGPKRSDLTRTRNRFGTSSTRNGTCSNFHCHAHGPLGPKRRFGRWFNQRKA
jgi:hypothetical protein